jgi:hypothetical protein
LTGEQSQDQGTSVNIRQIAGAVEFVYLRPGSPRNCFRCRGTSSSLPSCIWLVKTDTNGNVAGASSSNQLPGTTTEQAGALTATTANFPTVTPANGPTAIADSPVTANLVIQSFG